MREIKLSADELVEKILNLPGKHNLCLLDSCGVSYLNSHLLIAGINPIEKLSITENDAKKTLQIFDEKLLNPNLTAIFTISYDFGLKLNKIKSNHPNTTEPDIFLSLFDTLCIHDYKTNKTYLQGNENKFDEIEKLLFSTSIQKTKQVSQPPHISSNFTKKSYLKTIENIQELIRCGDTYQTNLTQQIRIELPNNLTPETIFQVLRKSHPAPFASFIRRENDIVISASPERFFKLENGKISTSPIKGTRPRGKTFSEDFELKYELLNSEKDRAENIMIVDLLRNDLGRVCKFGTVIVEKLCDLEEHPTLFHLVSTISGELNQNINLSDILNAVFPCGSITGAPKIRTMQIIDEIEPDSRGLSMGAIGFATTKTINGKIQKHLDLSVAIRTMTIRGNEATFNVGGGIVIDSIPENEYAETLTKAKALLNAIGAKEI